MSTVNAPKVGETTTDEALLGRRDAFHVPGILVKSAHWVSPGDRVIFVDEGLTEVKSDYTSRYQAVVDPFLDADMVRPGTLFWVFPVPGTTSNLTHRFDVTLHPKVETAPATEDDDSCRGCYGEPVEEDDGSCKGCYD